MKKAFAAAVIFLSLAAPALAAAPGEIAGVIKAEQPYGSAKLRKFFISVYDAALWTDAPQWSMQSPFALSIAYRVSLSKSDLTDSTVKEMAHVDPRLDAAALAAYRGQLNKVYADVNSGDTITALYTPDGVVHFFHNGHATGEVHDRTFAQSFFDIWLSPATSEPGLRAGLLRLGS
ncbi:MAG TPA: chalcone isomerase family protein [Rhizomicrobium sp.]|nr:chalcone isomerase family protein [Rhizomicrobium sp.]